MIALDDFSDAVGAGILSGTSWANLGNVVLNGTTITVGNTALNDNGWGLENTLIDAHLMQSITIVAQRDSGNASQFFVIAFEDGGSDAAIFSIPTSSFTTGAMTTVEIPILSWGNVNPAAITGWTIGGGTGGVVPFRMTLDDLSMSSSAIPEPATYAALGGVLVLGFAVWRRRASTVA